MSKLIFEASTEPTLGVELEMALVDAETMALSSSIRQVLEALPDRYSGRVKPELMQCYLEINTEICHTVADAERDLREKVLAVEKAAAGLGLRLFWGGTHPFSLWQHQQPTPKDRYSRLLENLQDMGNRLVTFGFHVHVGVDSGDKAVMICDRIMRHLPTLLALSSNSPFWNNRVTGLHSHRSKIMEGLPTAGLPSLMRNWSEFVWLVNHLVDTGFINSIRDIWWDVRPHHNFGTVEVRVCDIPGNLNDALALTALIHCLVHSLSAQIDEGTYQHDCHPMLVRQNKWRAARYGLDAQLVDVYTYKPRPAREAVCELVELLRPSAEQLGCQPYLEDVTRWASGPDWAERQLEILEDTGSPVEVVRQMAAQSTLLD